MSFLRHIGKQGDRKVAVIFREVPGEPHMCLVTYPEVLNQHIHDPLMQCIESDIGQNSENLADALNRTYTKDGTIILQKLHAEGMLKKVNTETVVMTPAPNVRIKLHELNRLLDKMQQGEEAIKEMAEIDSSLGLQDPADVARRMRGDKSRPQTTQPANSALDDSSLAQNFISQAEKMQREAQSLLAEAERMRCEAIALDPSLAPKPARKTTAKKPAAKTTTSKKASKVNVA
jgi:hypothetical protein